MQGKEGTIYTVPGCKMRGYREVSREEAGFIEACICRRTISSRTLYASLALAAAVIAAMAVYASFFYPACILLVVLCALLAICCIYGEMKGRRIRAIISSGAYHVMDARAYEILPCISTDTMMNVRVRDMEGRHLWQPLRMERAAALEAKENEDTAFFLVKYYYNGKSCFECIPVNRWLAIYGGQDMYRRKRGDAGPEVADCRTGAGKNREGYPGCCDVE